MLTLILLLPLIGGLCLLLFSQQSHGQKTPWFVGLWTSGLTLFLAGLLAYQFDTTSCDIQFAYHKMIIPSLHAAYHLGVDGLSVVFVGLTTFLFPLALLISYPAVKNRLRDYVAALLILESCIIGLFVTRNLLMFYMCFEMVLMPLFFIIGIWGGKDRLKACYKMFLYTMAGSLLMLLAVIYVMLLANSGDIGVIQTIHIDGPRQYILAIAFLIAFAIKVPLWPFHTWLPDAHGEAPTAGSMILAGIVLKMGGYGLVRLLLTFFPESCMFYAPTLMTLSTIAILYGSCVAFAQTDIKKLMAYASIGHMGVVTLGLFSFQPLAYTGALLQMVSHGLTSAGLFLCAGLLYHRTHTRNIADYGGVASRMPFFATGFLVIIMGTIGLPGTSGFMGEIMVLIGVFYVHPIWTALAGCGVILSAAYGLWFYGRICFGPCQDNDKPLTPLSLYENLALFLIVLSILFVGLYPQFILTYLDVSASPLPSLISSPLLN
jgi:NADH-quinone oxidoreductase subunit M